MKLAEVLVPELRQELAGTRSVLARLPPDRLDWRPAEKSRTLGQLAAHVAGLPGRFIATLRESGLDGDRAPTVAPDSAAGIGEAFERNAAAALATLAALSDEELLLSWRYTRGDQLVFEMPRLAVARAAGLNHMIHHRGQLSVYLRLLGVPLPPLYGPTADEAAS